MMWFKVTQKEMRYLGYFIAEFDTQNKKIAQSGHTAAPTILQSWVRIPNTESRYAFI